MTYRILSPALAEMTESADYYEAQVAGLGADFVMEVDLAIGRILQFPQAWGRISNKCRHCQLRRFPYSIIYAIQDTGEMVVVSVFHHSRAPFSWERNL